MNTKETTKNTQAENEKTKSSSGRRRVVADLVYTAMFAALICVCSIISIPVGAVPVTLQTLAVCTAAAVLGFRRGSLCTVVYVLLGAAGLPVFQGLTGGIGVLLGPTGGYIIGFIFTALIVGFASDKFRKKLFPLIISMVIGVLVCYACGTPWFMFVTKMDLMTSLGYCVFPFLLPDAVKIAAAAIIANRLGRLLPELH